jgi:hypothetical protein
LLGRDEVVVLKIVAEVKGFLDFVLYEYKTVFGKFRPCASNILIAADIVVLQNIDSVVE